MFLPFNKLSYRIEGVTLFNPWPLKRFDLVHAFNRIPLGPTPFVIGFESHLPRAFGLEHTSYYKFLLRRLAGDQCRRIVGISNFALRVFRAANEADPLYPKLEEKLVMRYPAMELPAAIDVMESAPAEPLLATFVGNHFGRKGGCVAVRTAELAHKARFPLIIRIVSTLDVGGSIWTDPPDGEFFTPYFKLISLPNVQFFRGLPNHEVLQLLRSSHFSLLPTFSDTFGYSAIESMANFTPVIATRQCALPEFVLDGKTGILLDIPLNARGEWDQHAYGPRNGRRYAQNYRDEIERLAAETFNAIVSTFNQPGRFQSLRKNARQMAALKFDRSTASEFWDRLYTAALNPSLNSHVFERARN